MKIDVKIGLWIALLSLFGACSTLNKTALQPKIDPVTEKEADLVYQDFMFLKSQLLIYSNQLNQAKLNLETYLSVKTGPPSFDGAADFKIMLARLFLRQGDFSAASQVYFDLLSNHYENIEALSEVARFFYTIQSYEQALTLYQHLIKVEPKNENHLIYAGLISLDLKQYGSSKKFFNQILRGFPDSAHLGHFYLGHLSRQQKRYKTSLWHYDQCSKKAPSGFSACVLDQSEVLIELERKTEAYNVLKVFLKDFKDESVLKKITEMYFADYNYLDALTYMFELEKLKPYDINVKRKVGQLLMTNKEFSEALTRFRLVSANSDAKDEDHLNVIRALQASKESGKAKEFIKSLARTKDLSEDFFLEKQRFEKDVEADFIRLCPFVKKENKSHCYYVSGLVFLGNEKLQQAEKSFKRSLNSNKKYYKSLYMLGRIYTDYDNKEKKGLKYVVKALDVEPNYDLALNYMAFTWAEKGVNLDESLAYSQRALAQDPNNGHFLDTFGYVLFKMGEYENALPIFKRAVRLIPNNPEVYEHIADTYAGLNQPKKALSFYELASALLKGENLKRLGGKIARYKQNNSRRLGAITVDKSSSSSRDISNRMPAAYEEE